MEEYTFNNDIIRFESVSQDKKEIYLNDTKSDKYLFWTHYIDASDIIYLTKDMSEVYWEKPDTNFNITEDIAQEIYNRL